MILNKTRSMQIGGSISARTEYTPIDIEWEDVGKEVRSTPAARVPKADTSGLDKYFNYQLDGLESDKAMMGDKIENLRAKLEKGPGEGYSMDQYRADVQRLRRLVTVGVSGLKQKEARFRDVTNAATAARSDLAIQGGKAFVQDNQGNYSIVPVHEMLTAREEGKAKYTPQTVGSALEHRASNTTFHGYGGGMGEELEGIIRSIRPSSDIEKQIKSAFTGLGSTTQSDSGRKMIAGQDANSLVDLLESKMFGKKDPKLETEYKEKHKSNLANLDHAYNALLSTVQSSGVMEGLKRNAYGEYMAIYGDKADAPKAETWVDNRIKDRLNSSMLAYLKDEGATSTKAASKSGKSGGGDDVNVNPLMNSVVYPTVESSSFEVYSEDGELQSISAPLSTLPSELFGRTHGLQDANINKEELSISNNDTLKYLTHGNNLKDNFFLASEDNLSLDELGPDNANGVKYAMLDPDYTPQVMHNVLTYRQDNGKIGIAWELTDEANRIVRDRAEKKQPPLSNEQLLKHLEFTDAYRNYANKNVKIRKALQAQVIVPIDLKRFFMDRAYTDRFEHLLYGAEQDDDITKAMYTKAMLANDSNRANSFIPDNFLRGKTLHKFNTYSILDTDAEIQAHANQIYKTDKKSMGEMARGDEMRLDQRYN